MKPKIDHRPSGCMAAIQDNAGPITTPLYVRELRPMSGRAEIPVPFLMSRISMFIPCTVLSCFLFLRKRGTENQELEGRKGRAGLVGTNADQWCRGRTN